MESEYGNVKENRSRFSHRISALLTDASYIYDRGGPADPVFMDWQKRQLRTLIYCAFRDDSLDGTVSKGALLMAYSRANCDWNDRQEYRGMESWFRERFIHTMSP
jgi:hypothetical protein